MHIYSNIISIENLFQAWDEFKRGKRRKKDVQIFERDLEDNLFDLHWRLKRKTYRHGKYKAFYVSDPKRRHIHKALVEDRIVHHLLYKFLYKLWNKTFIHDSYSSRVDKGTHRGVKRLYSFVRKVSGNYTRDCWALKCDVKKFFASVDHEILFGLLRKRAKDDDIFWLLHEIVDSFHASSGKGIPLGNLTSQVFANIYLSGFDHFVKHKLKAKYYLRYADDFLILSEDKRVLENYVELVKGYLTKNLNLDLHPSKVVFRQLDWGIDFLGYVVLPYYILPRTKTKKRMFRKLKQKTQESNFNTSLQSYLGYLKHANSYKIATELKSRLWILSKQPEE